MVPTCASYKTFSTGEDYINLKGLGLYKTILVVTLYLFIFKVLANLFDFFPQRREINFIIPGLTSTCIN